MTTNNPIVLVIGSIGMTLVDIKIISTMAHLILAKTETVFMIFSQITVVTTASFSAM
jgi:hypothetical protein